MIKRSYTINSENGIHARPAALLVQTVSQFKSEVKIIKGEKGANARSIISIMGLGVKKGEQIYVEICGEDESVLCEAIETVLVRDFSASIIVEETPEVNDCATIL